MLRRTLLALLLLCLSAPAMAACVSQASAPAENAASQSAEHGSHHSPSSAPRPASHGSKHECIGCVAPLDKGVYRAASRPDYGLESFWPTLPTRMAEAFLPPEPEPPRTFA